MNRTPLADPPAKIIQALLLAESGGAFTDPATNGTWPLYISVMPDGEGVNDDIGCITDTTGKTPYRLLGSGQNINEYGIQIRTRARDYTTGFNLLSVTGRFLEKVRLHTLAIGVNNYTIDTVRQVTPPTSMGEDQQRRANFSLNLLLSLIAA